MGFSCGPWEPGLGSVWAPCGCLVGSFWAPFGLLLGSLWAPVRHRVVLGRGVGVARFRICRVKVAFFLPPFGWLYGSLSVLSFFRFRLYILLFCVVRVSAGIAVSSRRAPCATTTHAVS